MISFFGDPESKVFALETNDKLDDLSIEKLNWVKEDEKCDTYELRQRLELTSLAIETGAPVSYTHLTLPTICSV